LNISLCRRVIIVKPLKPISSECLKIQLRHSNTVSVANTSLLILVRELIGVRSEQYVRNPSAQYRTTEC